MRKDCRYNARARAAMGCYEAGHILQFLNSVALRGTDRLFDLDYPDVTVFLHLGNAKMCESESG